MWLKVVEPSLALGYKHTGLRDQGHIATLNHRRASFGTYMTITSTIFKRQLQSLHRTMSTSTTTNRIRVEMVSDAICPFCYIGYKNYDAGVSLAKKSNLNLDFDLEFKPFLLDPTLGNEPVNKRERYAAKFGGKERVAGMEKQMVERGKDVGINL